MDRFDKEFITEMFLDTDSITTMNRLVVAAANVISENNETLSSITDALKKERSQAILDSESIDSPEDSPTSRKRKKAFYEHTVQNYSEDEYFDRFKMRRTTIEALIAMLQDHINSNSIVPINKKIHVFMYLLTTDACYGEVGALFGLNKSSVAYIFHEIASLLANQRDMFICWPSSEEQHITRVKVNSRFKFPNCVGFIDTCRFRVGSKQNKKNKFKTALLQAVCNESLSFIHIHISVKGTTKKTKLFKESALSHELKNLIDFENHILGDSVYKLKKNLMTPFSSEEVLTPEEMKFNEIHWKARSYIGHAFELLKERFMKLNHIDITKDEYINTLIVASCVLHNFILLHEGCPELKEEPVTCDDGVTIDTSIVQTAEEKRQFLCNYINYIDCT